ncbi:hypothetical protein CYMTET_49507 [Cymbomonas tetramitiformis]|uniref:Photolyase/cryptochrome alpha/beta domain-containing protein n=1 Tax=Cymbomonas tetramitiformis TaxID=36881 RepID=A0AAE0BRQ0_9CHLO|nr:hypothetical protein CYMTET_49507 [Cymbomonas tetramitiformis]|eukprot:gene20931-25106_t
MKLGTEAPNLIVWHRRDLRLVDNPLYERVESFGRVIPVYCFDERDFARQPSTVQDTWDVVRTGPHAARFLLEAVQDLRLSLRERGSDLLIRFGKPHEVLLELAVQIATTDELSGQVEVCWNEEPGVDESAASERVRQTLRSWPCNGRTTSDFSCTLFHPDDLPTGLDSWLKLAHPRQMHKRKARRNSPPRVPRASSSGDARPQEMRINVSAARLEGMPEIMGEWRRAARGSSPVRPAKPAPAALPPLPPFIESGELPSYAQLMEDTISIKSGRPLFGILSDDIAAVVKAACQTPPTTSAFPLRGGERHGASRLEGFVREGKAAAADRSRAGGGLDSSSKIGAYLALGCSSPRSVWEFCGPGTGAEWLASHLEIRDYFMFKMLQLGPQSFRRRVSSKAQAAVLTWRTLRGGEEDTPGTAAHDWARWATARTGLPLVDAGMRELAATGYCSNRCRQNIASVLAKDLLIDWRLGAELFQWLLVDHDVSSNWGNWAYFSGVGSDPKNRHFKTISQSMKYDPEAEYLHSWLPELRHLPVCNAHRPFQYCSTWPVPVVNPSTQLTWQDTVATTEVGVEGATLKIEPDVEAA